MSPKDFLKSLERKTVTDEVVATLEDAILSGKFKPNERLVEREIAERLGVSRAPIREALIRLKGLGLVRELRRGVNVISAISEKEIEELYTIKELIESYCISEGCLRGDEGYTERLEAIVGDMEKEMKKDNLNRYRELNNRFHEEIVKSTRNSKLFEIYLDVVRQIRWCQKYTLFSLRIKESLSEHKKMIRLFKTKDTKKLNTAVSEHNRQALRQLKINLQEIKYKSGEEGERRTK
jgi:DNA-binding GntR family transcriptional regulator